MPGSEEVSRALRSPFPGSCVENLSEPTEGQALTALAGLDALEQQATGDPVGSLLVGSCDNGALWDLEAFETLLGDPGVDVVIWGARGHIPALRAPGHFGWVREEGGVVSGVSVKKPLRDPTRDPVVVGTFFFRRSGDFRRCVKRLIARNGRVNGEFYMDSCIEDALELGFHCRLLEVSAFVSWGTPDELRTFEYWQSCFHKWGGHPYRLELDTRVPKKSISSLDATFRNGHPIFRGWLDSNPDFVIPVQKMQDKLYSFGSRLAERIISHYIKHEFIQIPLPVVESKFALLKAQIKRVLAHPSEFRKPRLGQPPEVLDPVDVVPQPALLLANSFLP